MPGKKKTPLVAICGRPNVGKSTLFNRITGKTRAIVHAEEGITRDRAYAHARYGDYSFRVVDTGGIVESPTDSIVDKMQQQVRVALKEAKVILFVVDGQQPITRTDEQLREELFTFGKPIVLVVNKIDNDKMDVNKLDFYALGMGDPIAISSGHALGIDALFEAIVARLPKPEPALEEEEDAEPEEEKPITRVAIIGKPNVGKSSFINAILNEERTIVDNTPGTTRDAIDIEFQWKDKDYLLIDTAGLRKKAGIRKDVEHFSVARSLRAVRRADVCMLLMDGTDGICEQDKRILDYVREQGRAIVLVWSKWDLVENKEARFKQLQDDLDFKAPFLKYAPQITISNVTRTRLFKTFEYIDRVAAEAEKRIPTAELNRIMEDVRAHHTPPSKGGKHPKILYATQAGVKPTTFVLFVNQSRLFHFSYVRFIENVLRDKYGFEGVPITIELREGRPSK
jgi:GTP-binding protein